MLLNQRWGQQQQQQQMQVCRLEGVCWAIATYNKGGSGSPDVANHAKRRAGLLQSNTQGNRMTPQQPFVLTSTSSNLIATTQSITKKVSNSPLSNTAPRSGPGWGLTGFYDACDFHARQCMQLAAELLFLKRQTVKQTLQQRSLTPTPGTQLTHHRHLQERGACQMQSLLQIKWPALETYSSRQYAPSQPQPTTL